MGPIDGTIVPAAAGGSMPFLPAACMRVLRTIHDHYPNAWCRYGFVDAFNPLTNWYDTDVVAIDTGITMLMAENARSGFVWDTFMKNTEATKGHGCGRFQALYASSVTPRVNRPCVFSLCPSKQQINHLTHRTYLDTAPVADGSTPGTRPPCRRLHTSNRNPGRNIRKSMSSKLDEPKRLAPVSNGRSPAKRRLVLNAFVR